MSQDRMTTGSTHSAPPSEVDEGIALAKAGAKAQARTVFRRVIGRKPEDEQAWLWLAWVADTRTASRRILQEALAFLPDSKAIRDGLAWVESNTASPDQGPQLASRRGPSGGKKAGRGESLVSLSAGLDRVSLWGKGRRRALRGDLVAMQSLTENIRARVGHLLSAVRWPSGRSVLTALLALGTIAGLAAIVWLGISHARSQPRVTLALELPPAVPNATATPTTEKLVEPLWIQVRVAISQENWSKVVEYLDDIRAVDPMNERARRQLSQAHYEIGLVEINDNQLSQAHASLNKAIRLDATDERLQDLRHKLELYMHGLGCYQQQDWQLAVDTLSRAYRLDSGFRDTAAMLGKSHYHVGIEKQDDELWEEARDAFKAAIALLPGLEDAHARLAQVMDILIPPNRIELDLSDRLVTVYEGHRPIHVFTACTGRPSAPTIPGRYQVKTKLPSAYASKWDLDMPYWLGIYDAGGSENGFHALPILSSGAVLWRGALGTGCSYGCIVLDTPNAIALYNWADIGTVVLINR